VVNGTLIPADFSKLVKTGQYNKEANIMWGTNHDEAGFVILTLFPNVVPIVNASEIFDAFLDQNRTAQILNSTAYNLDPCIADAARDTFTRFGTD